MSKMMAETLKIVYETWDRKKVITGIQVETIWIIETDSWVM